ncbi:hypothetical protein JCM3765_003719 [Sporobolomyces pararoseus]
MDLQQSKPDHLSRLPEKVLDLIFELVYTGGNSRPLPLSKSLSKYFYRHFYRTIRITSYKELTRLCARATQKNLKQTRKFTIDIPLVSEKKETPDPGHPKEEVFASFLNKLGANAAHVSVSGSSRLAQVVASGLVASEALPQLKTLELSSTFADLDDPWHPAYYAPLLYYPRLSIFALNILRSPGSIKPSSKPFPVNFLSTLPPKSVTLQGPLGASPFSRNLITRFSRLVELSIYDTCTPSTGLAPLIESIVQPEALNTLSIGCDEIDQALAIAIIKSLDRFPELNRLRLLKGFSFGSQEFYQALEGLDLRAFTFSQNAIISSTLLRGLFADDEAHKVLVLDEVRWVDEEGKVISDADREREEIGRVLQMCRDLGVFVTGTTAKQYLKGLEKTPVGEMSVGQMASMLVEQLTLKELRRFVNSGDRV